MFATQIDKLTEFFTLPVNFIPDIITVPIIIFFIILFVKSALDYKAILLLFGLVMATLTVLGIDSQFNIFILLQTVIESILDVLF